MPGDFLIITGVQQSGARFRPSDWNERLSSTLASLHPDNRLHYSPWVQPCAIDGEACLVIAPGFEAADPDAYRYVMDFARANELRIQPDRRLDPDRRPRAL
jgi:hypothetical protein